MTKQELKEAWNKLLKWQRSNRLITEFMIQEMDDGLRIGVKPIRSPHFVYMDSKID